MTEISTLPASMDSTAVVSTTIGTKCPHCGQEFSDEAFNIAVFLYGIFFLVGKEIGYAGITCPRCLNTIRHQNNKDSILSLKQMLSSMIYLGNSMVDPQLRYYSSLNGSPQDISSIGRFEIPYISHELGGNEPPTLLEAITVYLEENPDLEENHLCSYIDDGNDPSGTICNVWWIHENDAEKLIQIENIKGIKIFPRYYHHCELIEGVDRFCCNYGYVNIYLENLKNRAVRNQEKLEQELILQGIDLKDVIEATPGMIDPREIEFIQSQDQKYNASKITKMPGDFFDILIADPEPWGIQAPVSQLCKGFWKTKSPFTTVALPLSLSQFSPHPFKDTAENQWLQQVKDDILAEFIKPYVQTYLIQNYASFIRGYLEIIQNRSFCYADLWTLKERYLKGLHALVQKDKQLENKNLFYRQNGFWVVSYNGNETLVQNLDGMAYIQFLLQYKGKKFSYVEIEKLLNGAVAIEDGNKEVHVEPEIMEKGFSLSLTRQDMITKEQLDQALQEKEKVLEKMQTAEDVGNENLYNELNSYLEKINLFLKESTYTVKKGKKEEIKIKRFRNSSDYKVKKDNVDRVLKYTLSSLEEQNEAAYKHLKASIINKRGEIWYEPAVDTDWFTG